MTQLSLDLLRINIYYNQLISSKAYQKLYDDIKANGILMPLIVEKDPKNLTRYLIVDGIYRYKIAKELGYDKVPCTILGMDQ